MELLADIGPGIDRRYRDELVERFELEVDRRCGTYLTGNRQKVALVAAFATEAPVLIFDVEAVCQRVGILREGRLVEVADLGDLRRLRLTEVDVSFRGTPPDLSSCPECQG